MLLNFCHPCLRPEVTCSTVSTDGYDVTNLTSDTQNGFLAYSCIKPPVNIDFTFICDIQISRVIIWPCVGSQKSSGFQLQVKPVTSDVTPYVTLSNGYLDPTDIGVYFYRRDLNETNIFAPPGFLERYIKITNPLAVNKTNNLRICIVRTDNSVPAIGKLEIWGRVARSCGIDVIAGVNALWMQEHSPSITMKNRTEQSSPISSNNNESTRQSPVLEIPDDFLDPITYEIMIQPIVLPSGKIIDQRTLERQEQTNALWGRLPSDPFTGIPFSISCKPVVATSLKARIDKFLLENSNVEEIKKLPRTTGRKTKQSALHEKLFNTSGISDPNDQSKNDSTCMPTKSNHTLKRRQQHDTSMYRHKLPVTVTCTIPVVNSIEHKRKLPKIRKIMEESASGSNFDIQVNNKANISIGIDSDLKLNITSVLSGLKSFTTTRTHEVTEVAKSCLCCTDGILYQLPCTHIMCRKILTSIDNLMCQLCGAPFKTSDPKRIHV